MISIRKRYPSVALAAFDSVSVAAAMAVAYYLRIEGSFLPYYGPQDLAGYAVISAAMIPVWIGIHFAARLYDPDVTGSGMEEYLQIFKASTFAVVVMIALAFWDRGLLLSRGWVLLSWFLSLVLLLLGRFTIRCLILRRRRRGEGCARAIAVGVNNRAIHIAHQFNQNRSGGIVVVAFLDDTLPVGAVVTESLSVWGSPAELAEAVRALDATEVLVVSEALDWETYQDVVHQGSRFPPSVRMRICPRLDELLSSGVRLGKKADVPVLTLAGLRIDARAAVLKRGMDCIVACILLVLTAPVFALISVLVRFLDHAPVLDRYRAIGLLGAPFTAFKFHTGLLGTTRRSYAPSVRVLPDRASGTSILGAFLYRTALDKVPQLWNVLKGDMSLVGPRVSTISERELVSLWLPAISNLRPGMTGPWALLNATNLDEEMQATLYYARNWNFARDITILLRTVLNILKTRGSVSSGYVPSPTCAARGELLKPSLERVGR